MPRWKYRDTEVVSLKKCVIEALRKALSHGYQLSPDAIEYLEEVNDPISIISDILNQVHRKNLYVINRKLIENYLDHTNLKENAKYRQLAKAKDFDIEIEVLENPSSVHIETSFKGFLDHFISRYQQLSRILRTRFDLKDAMTIADAKRSSSEVCVVGLVYEKRTTNSGNTLVSIEDPTGILDIIIPNDPIMKEKIRDVIPDICIGVRGTMRGGILIAKDIMFPEIIPPAPSKSPPLSVVLISDIHAGSSLFSQKAFYKFINWLKGKKGNSKMRTLAESVKYVIISGDLIDGAGIYPGQEKELSIKDVDKQYEFIANMLSEIPEHIHIILIPGNHDATSPALPYISFFKEYAYPIYELSNVSVLADPALISIHGTKILISHGRSLDDILSVTPGLSFTKEGVAKAMRNLLRYRHLAPLYGSRTPILPVPYDFLVIRTIPHILHMGHVHICTIHKYKGVLLVNSGTWQEQTSYQFSMGITPTPYKVPVVRLDTLQTFLLDFS